jgi:hypothetical protein
MVDLVTCENLRVQYTENKSAILKSSNLLNKSVTNSGFFGYIWKKILIRSEYFCCFENIYVVGSLYTNTMPNRALCKPNFCTPNIGPVIDIVDKYIFTALYCIKYID